MPEQKKFEPEAKKHGQTAAKSGGENLHDLASDIAVLLAKSQPTLSKDAEEALRGALKTLHDAIGKTLTGAQAGKGETGGAGVEDTVFAPRDLSAAKGAGYAPDKALAGDSTDVGGSGVTDSRRNIQVGGEIPSTAGTAKEALATTKAAVAEADRLPKQGEQDKFGKTLDHGTSINGHPVITQEALEKALETERTDIIEKQQAFTEQVVVAAVEKVLQQQVEREGVVEKQIDGLGSALNDAVRQMTDLEGRLRRVEKAGGVSQSGPRGEADSTVGVVRPAGNVWGGLWNRPVKEATGKY